MKQKQIILKKKNIKICNSNPLILIAGVCAIEDLQSTEFSASKLKEVTQELNIAFIFKASYDKANRSSIDSYRGPGLIKGLSILSKIKEKYDVPLLVDVHCRTEIKETAKIADIIQIPAFLCRQTDLIIDCAKTGLPINIKKGQFIAPEDTINIIKKIKSTGNDNILLTERGTAFGYHNLVVDIRSLEIMKDTGYPVIYDATHSVQLPGGLGKSTGGQSQFILPLSRSCVATGISGVFIEVHKNPKKALSDGANSIQISKVKEYLEDIIKIDRLIKH